VNWLTPPALLAAWVVADSDIIQAHLALVAGVKNDQLSEAARRPANEIATVTPSSCDLPLVATGSGNGCCVQQALMPLIIILRWFWT
jgi:hypothetical protein